MTKASERVAVFRALHESGCFIIPNPWDVGSARMLEGMGFKALATTSSGFAWTLGRRDNHVTLLEALDHIGSISNSVRIPVSADFEDGFGREPERLRQSIQQAVVTGIAGLSIEDSTRNADAPLYDFELALDRIRAAREAIDRSRVRLVLTARTEGYIVGRPHLDETIKRLKAFADVGADCVYAPGVRSLSEIKEIVDAVHPKPVNVLVTSGFATMEQLAAIGVRRISVGGALARSAWGAFMNAAQSIAQTGSFAVLERGAGTEQLEEFFLPADG